MSINGFERYLKRETEYISESFFEEHIQRNKAVIIADNAGMGKSTLLTNFSNLLKNEKRWKIRINLNQYTTVLYKIPKKFSKDIDNLHLNFKNFNFEEKDYGKLILKLCMASKSSADEKLTFENRIFNHFFTKRGILYIFDGFDEINPNYGEIILNLLDILQKNENNRIWIASRKNFKKQLEEKLKTFSYDLKPFDKKDQEIFLKQYWTSNYKKEKGNDMPNQDRLSIYIKKLIDEASKTIGDIIGIPLQTKMFAEIFQEKHDDSNDESSWVSGFEYVEANNAPKVLNISSKLNISMLYEKFFHEKICKYYLYGKDVVDRSKPNAKDQEHYTLEAEYPIHKVFGYLALTDQNDDTLLTEQERKKIQKWHAEFETGEKKMGIIDNFNEVHTKPIFNHFTYAEYFAACYLTEKMCDSFTNVEHILKLTNKIFDKDVPVFVKCFIYKLKQEIDKTRINAEHILKLISELGLLNCVNVFIKSKDFNNVLSDVNKSWRNALHHAAKKEQFDVVVFITFYMYTIIRTPNHNIALHCLSNFIFHGGNIINSYAPKIKNLLNDIKIASETNVIPKNCDNNKLCNFFDIKSRDENTKTNAMEAIKLHFNGENLNNLLKNFSSNCIINIVKVFKLPIMEFKSEFIGDICSRYDLREEEKIEIFEAIFYRVAENMENPIYVTEKLLKIIIENDNVKLLNRLLTREKLFFHVDDLYGCFQTACQIDAVEIVKELLIYLKKTKYINERPFNDSPLYYALRYNTKIETVKFVMNVMEKNLNIVNLNEALFIAVEYNSNIQTIDYLIEKGGNPKYKPANSEMSSLEVASQLGYFDIVNYFKEKFGDVLVNWEKEEMDYKLSIKYQHSRDEQGNTSLHLAVPSNITKFIDSLLEMEAPYNAKNNKKETPEMLAEKNPEVKKLLKEIDKYFISAQKNDFEFLKNKKDIKKKKININLVKDEYGMTLLHYAIMKGNIQALKNLLHYRTEDNDKLLFFAVECNNLEMVKIILKNVKKMKELEYSSFVAAKNYKITEKNDCTIFLSRVDKCLTHVYNRNNQEIKNELEKITDNENFNVIANFAVKERQSIVDYAKKDYEVAKYLLGKGIFIQTLMLRTNLNVNTHNLKIEKVMSLWTELAELVYSQENDQTSIIKYYNNQFTKALSFFSINNEEADKIIANVRFKFGHLPRSTLLHIATILNEEKIVDWLIKEKHADPNAINRQGNDVYDLAEKYHFTKVLSILPPRKKNLKRHIIESDEKNQKRTKI